jgi:hypothetical protein
MTSLEIIPFTQMYPVGSSAMPWFLIVGSPASLEGASSRRVVE